MLSDEALDKLDKELEGESTDGKELGDTSTSTVVNGTDDPNVHEVVSIYSEKIIKFPGIILLISETNNQY